MNQLLKVRLIFLIDIETTYINKYIQFYLMSRLVTGSITADVNLLFTYFTPYKVLAQCAKDHGYGSHLEPLVGSLLTVHPAANGYPVETLGI